MQALFTPAIHLSNRLSFKQKFALVFLLSAVALAYFFMVLAADRSQVIERTDYEISASRYIVPLRNLVEHVAQTRGMTNAYLNGASQFEAKIQSRRQMVNEDFDSLLQVDRELGDALNTQGLPLELQDRWGSITATAFNRPAADVFARYTHLIADIIDLMDTIGRTGRMRQDPDPVNSYMINSLLSTLPNQVEALGVLRGKGSGVLAADELTTDNKLKIASLADQRTALKLKKDMRYLFAASPQLEARLREPYEYAERQLDGFLKLANTEIVQASSANMDSTRFFSTGSDAIGSLLILFDSIQPALEQRMADQAQKARDNINFYFAMLFIVALVLIYIFVGIYLAIKKNLIQVQSSADDICDGKLDTHIALNTRDELKTIAESFNEISDSIRRSIMSIKDSSLEISRVAEEIASESTNSAAGMSVQAQELSQASSAVTEMTESVREVARNTEVASVSAQQATSEADNGSQVVQQTITAINTLANNVNEVVAVVETLKENSGNITGILDVIRGIAEQTNLLALNAAIEAARAGEQGRGFAVVADEVRTLASRTQDSTLEIQNMIELIQGGINEVSAAMGASSDHTAQAVENSQAAGQALSTIAQSVSEISNMSLQIASGAEEQSYASEEIARSVVTIAGASDDASRSSQVLAESGSRLSAMAKEMRLIISDYHVDRDLFNKEERVLHLLQWNSNYELGIDESDRQHKTMVDMMNKVHIMSAKGRDSAAIAKSLDSLIRYTEIHFGWEENLFDSYDYPNSDEHKSEHRKLITELREHQKRIEVGSKREIDKELKQLNDWLINHIHHSDSGYARHLKATGKF
ncbi:bacteriohemerythrin [Pseudomaricurvus alkylphenolicus]|uniref:bacteriohemerythrin n=1 Tax=Pseudomaricurvus alkylphenolicus TaxID=1306991 RepID=UPI00141E2EE6|nr:bacteriohemerythrin [Pseudomaricurvus alkylphenolicus]NIB38604.1 bacteriohemerythrin [Pseudomaricurvus alkylphenolicus]